MKSSLIELYRKNHLYTLFYDESDGLIYKSPTSKGYTFQNFYLVGIVSIITLNLLNNFYQEYNNLIIDISLFILSLVIGYDSAGRLYKHYYDEERTRSIILDDSFLEECLKKGIKQSRIEIISLFISPLLAIIGIVGFFFVNTMSPLIMGCFCLSLFRVSYFMKPLKRRKIIHKLQNEII
ncbi:MAG TPA: hypothetical protein VK108_04710 [Pseudogracilibacillus sp.]|nr:hypothetical protein [Pseudogracilibacillus sp.]